MLYAEHTWGHSSTITNPYDTMVLNLDMRKNSYASKAHEAASLMLCSIAEKKGDMLRYYNTTGTVRAVGVSHTSQPQLIEFYIETLALEDVEVRDLAGNLYTCQVSLTRADAKSALLIRCLTAKKKNTPTLPVTKLRKR